jgi:peptidyl-tRNA hydrolase, PTH1 family
MLAPRLIVGLGNPGAEYEATRHNVGFWLVDQFADKLKATLAPQGKFFGRAARAGDLWLLQPTTFGIRLKQGGGNGGHNGLKDIQARLGTPDFWRLRLGIGHPRELNLTQQVVDFVLHPPRKEEMPEIEHALARCLLAWPKIAGGDYAGAQRQLHGKAV